MNNFKNIYFYLAALCKVCSYLSAILKGKRLNSRNTMQNETQM